MDLFRQRFGFQRPVEKWVKIMAVFSVVIAIIYGITFIHNIRILTATPKVVAGLNSIMRECVTRNSEQYCERELKSPVYHTNAGLIRAASVVVAAVRLGYEIWLSKTLIEAASQGNGLELKAWWNKRVTCTASDLIFALQLPALVYNEMWIIMNLTFYIYHFWELWLVRQFWLLLELA